MPIYIYRCSKCKAHTTIVHKIHEDIEVKCPKCKKLMSIEIQPVSFDIRGYCADNGYSKKEEE